MYEDLNTDSLPPVQSDEFLPPVSLWTTLGGMLMVTIVGVALTLASIIKYNVTVKASAIVRPTGELRIVQAKAAGTVTRILTKENQVVKQGDPIAYIDNSILRSRRSQLQENIRNEHLQLKRVADQIQAIDAEKLDETDVMQRTIASAQADLSGKQRDYKDTQVTTITATKEAEAALDLARTEMNQYHQLASSGAVALLQVREKEAAFKEAQAKLDQAKTRLNPSAATVIEAKQQIAQARAKGESTLATLNQQRESLLNTQVQTQKQLDDDTKQLEQLGIEISQTYVLAPYSGTILKLDLRNSGQVVQAGEEIAQIAPSDAPLVVKARVNSQDIAKIHVCQQENVLNCQQGKVQLQVSAYPYPDYGTLKGAVRAIAPDAVTSQANTGGQAVPYYEVKIQPERPYLVKDNRYYPLKPGMEVTANIISREETVLTFLLRKARLKADF
ncbi:MAG: HlyD family efflux transporter periplasmic adaptor subunit [Chroococcidiopsidaceae cyanobacterium CP_BM_ER_R8_30]|nr:HlyD family efflux transporter periplasmic adaptor subunit [Chroococcidiopsidaceae cyanobacterium CP_BM_ER_R8_30]